MILCDFRRQEQLVLDKNMIAVSLFSRMRQQNVELSGNRDLLIKH